VPHLFRQHPEKPGSSRMVTVQHISFSPRIRYLHHLLSDAECDHIVRVAGPLFSRSPVRGSVTRVRTSTTAMLGGRLDDDVVMAVRIPLSRTREPPAPLPAPLPTPLSTPLPAPLPTPLPHTFLPPLSFHR
jgi:hypothetical protein